MILVVFDHSLNSSYSLGPPGKTHFTNKIHSHIYSAQINFLAFHFYFNKTKFTRKKENKSVCETRFPNLSLQCLAAAPTMTLI